MLTTIREVAKKLNISIYMVSRALDGYEHVADQTRELVIRPELLIRASTGHFDISAPYPVW